MLIQLLDEDKVEKFMESVIIRSQEDMILKDWERKQLDELVEYTALENAKEEGLSTGEAKGRAAGIVERNIEIAKKMLTDNVEVDTIVKYTGLSKEQIENLSGKPKNE